MLLYEPGMVCCFMGTLGSGKSLHMSLQAYWATRRTNTDVYVNYETFFPKSHRINGIRHLVRIENGLLYIDEMQSLLDSRSFGKNVDITQWLLLIRKVGLGLFYTTQHIDFVDVRLRQITDIVFEQKKAVHYGQKSTLIKTYALEGNTAHFKGKNVLLHKPGMYSLYNTKDRRVKLTLDSYEMPFSADLLDDKLEKSEAEATIPRTRVPSRRAG